MKKTKLFVASPRCIQLLCLTAILFLAGCKKDIGTAVTPEEEVSAQARGGGHGHGDDDNLKGFNQVNLVGNNALYSPIAIDPALINGWGIAFSPTGIAWVSSQGGHASTVYNGEGTTVLGPVLIPSPGGPEGGNPTGIVFNAIATDFVIPSGNPNAPTGARFIFVGVDGIVSGWNGSWGTHSYSQFNHVATSSYTGLALAANEGNNYLYAADFRGRKIVVWDKNWNPVSMSFKDSHIPWGYAPFNVQAIGEYLYVTYAKVGPDGRSKAGKGLGFVNIFKTNGKLVKRFADHDKLNAPWGVTMAPASFFPQEGMDDDDDDDNSGPGNGHGHDNYKHGQNNHHHDPQPAILVGNFGDGRINAYSLRGDFLGQLKSGKRKIQIDGLWAITFAPTTSTIDQSRLYFAAGPDHEMNGLFGYIRKPL